jgi:hypothetical protein
VYGNGTRRELSFRFEKYTPIFQADMYAIKACGVGSPGRDYKSRNTYILLNSQATIKALDN